MDNIIAASRLAEMLAQRTGITVEQANALIREYFAQAYNVIASGDNLCLKGLGTFNLTGNESAPLAFFPDPELAAKVNAPFAAFAPFPLDAGDTVIESPQPEPRPVAEPEPEMPETAEQPQPEPEPEPQPTPVTETEPAPAPQPEPKPTPEPLPEPKSEPDPEPKPVAPKETEPEPEPEHRHHSHSHTHTHVQQPTQIINCPGRGLQAFWFILAFALGIILGFGAGYYFHGNLDININRVTGTVTYPEDDLDTLGRAPAAPAATSAPAKDTASAKAEPAKAETAASEAAKPAEEPAKAAPVYDTIKGSVFLTTLARRHYGEVEYWVYIYEANPGLGNPNLIKPGTKVLIPAKSSLPLTGNHDADIKAAKRKQVQILNKYKRR